MKNERRATQLREIPAPIWALGFVSLLMDVSSEMIHALLPVYLVTGLWRIDGDRRRDRGYRRSDGVDREDLFRRALRTGSASASFWPSSATGSRR